ncbi:MAG TPA: class I SAM-dependent methyltransferase [Pirellulaceae bacterium]|nr:class I SAM-dependent methyltransferase [Pirellulaceae bacterium]
MSLDDDYELIDFGHGRKLERFGDRVLDRPSPAAEEMTPYGSAQWRDPCGRFERSAGERGFWQWRRRPEADWAMRTEGFVLGLEPSEFGHVGVFPEQQANWRLLSRYAAEAPRPPIVLNLFGYTGGSTLAVARHAEETVHVDSSKPMVERARRNAERSGLAERRIRWIVDDVRDFCRREVRRTRFYDAVILDPPSYGHGVKGKAWSIESHLVPLLEDIGRLLFAPAAPAGERLLLFSSHSPTIDRHRAADLVEQAIPRIAKGIPLTHRNRILDRSGRALDFGLTVGWRIAVD